MKASSNSELKTAPLTLLTLNNVSNSLWDKPILKNISWTTEFGQSWAILGPNGAGKSTLLKVVLGQLPYCGTIQRHKKIADFRKIAHVSFEQQKRLVTREEKKDRYEEYSGNEEHQLSGREAIDPGNKNSAKLLKITEQLGLENLLERPLRYFSNGETRKCLIVKALLSEPELLILDEPFDGLDISSVGWLRQTISGLIQNGPAVWLVSHRFEELVPEITNVLCLKAGEVFAQGLLSEILIPEKMKELYGDDAGRLTVSGFRFPDRSSISLQDSHPETVNRQADVIRMRNVNVCYGEKTVLKSFNWEVRRGENWKIVGPNGAGKSTLLSLISGDNLQAYSNEIYLFGKRRGTGESVWEIKQKIGLVSAEFQLRYREPISVLKVVLSGFFDSIGFYRPVTDTQKKTALNRIEFLQIVELIEQDFTRLSYGQQRLVLIARAMVKSPPLLILDEPCQGLDRVNRNRVLSLVNQIGQNTGTQILYVTHAEADRLGCVHQELRFEAAANGVFSPAIRSTT